MPAFNPPSYLPYGRMALNRAYIRGIDILWSPGFSLTVTGDLYSAYDNGYFGGYTFAIEFKHEFTVPNSNTYTLDWIVNDLYYIPPGGSPVHNLTSTTLSYVVSPSHGLHLTVQYFGFTTSQFTMLPPLPHYWAPLT